MAPTKPRTAPEDSRSEASSTKERAGNAHPPNNSKGRRALPTPTTLRDSVTVGATAYSGTGGSGAGASQETNAVSQWSSLDTPILHGYRYAYRLNTPSAFSNSYNQMVLSRAGIGRFSPTMARPRDQRRQSKEELGTAIRKHFNGLGIHENEVIVDFLYKVKWQDKNFRMRFSPNRNK